MVTIADSEAFRDDTRVLPQHQAGLTVLQSLVSDPNSPDARFQTLYQAEEAHRIIKEHHNTANDPFIVCGDMNDHPTKAPLIPR